MLSLFRMQASARATTLYVRCTNAQAWLDNISLTKDWLSQACSGFPSAEEGLRPWAKSGSGRSHDLTGVLLTSSLALKIIPASKRTGLCQRVGENTVLTGAPVGIERTLSYIVCQSSPNVTNYPSSHSCYSPDPILIPLPFSPCPVFSRLARGLRY